MRFCKVSFCLLLQYEICTVKECGVVQFSGQSRPVYPYEQGVYQGTHQARMLSVRIRFL